MTATENVALGMDKKKAKNNRVIAKAIEDIWIGRAHV